MEKMLLNGNKLLAFFNTPSTEGGTAKHLGIVDLNLFVLYWITPEQVKMVTGTTDDNIINQTKNISFRASSDFMQRSLRL